MHRTTAPPTREPDFSLVQGGPLFQCLLRAGLLRAPTDLLERRIIVSVMINWLPLLALSAWAGQLWGGPGVPFLLDVGAHARLLLSVPILLAAEVIVHQRIRVVVRQFSDRGIVVPADQPRFEELIASAMRLRNSVIVEVALLAIAIAGSYSLELRYAGAGESWRIHPAGDGMALTAAGYWYRYVSLTIFRFLILRWGFRLLIWFRFLWQVSRRVPLSLNALHPDGAGGLGFLSASAHAFVPVLLAQTITISGILGGKIWHEGATLPQFKLELTAWMVFLILLVLAPLLSFATHLAEAKRSGLREYGLVGSRYVADFRRKWIAGQSGPDEALVGSADIQSLADLSNSFEVVRGMGLVPFGRAAVIQLTLVTAAPLAPLALTMVPLEELIDKAMGVFF